MQMKYRILLMGNTVEMGGGDINKVNCYNTIALIIANTTSTNTTSTNTTSTNTKTNTQRPTRCKGTPSQFPGTGQTAGSEPLFQEAYPPITKFKRVSSDKMDQ